MKNNDAPFNVKKTVWTSALQSAVFYSGETWFTSDFRAVEAVYISSLKQLLGVRPTTCNDLVMIEAGVGNAKSYLEDRQCRFIHKLKSRDGFANTYISKVMSMAINVHSPAGLVIRRLLEAGPNYNSTEKCIESVKSVVRNATSSRRSTYLSINPELSVSCIYEKNTGIPEYSRIACTRIRLSSHRLRVETGRWSRINLQDRLCECGQIQTEEHVLLRCPLTLDLRNTIPLAHNCASISELLNQDIENMRLVCCLCARVLEYYC